jgi:hypothetical protein
MQFSQSRFLLCSSQRVSSTMIMPSKISTTSLSNLLFLLKKKKKKTINKMSLIVQLCEVGKETHSIYPIPQSLNEIKIIILKLELTLKVLFKLSLYL